MSTNDPERILVLASTGRDAALSCAVLTQGGLLAVLVPDIAALCAGIQQGAAAVLLTEEMLIPSEMGLLEETLHAQEPWSDLPILIFPSDGSMIQQRNPTSAFLTPLGNVQLLERPIRIATLWGALRAALRARRRQYITRDLLINQARAVQQRDRFLAMLGHELRSPLGAILMAERLLESGNEQTLARARAIIARQGRHLAILLDDLLDVARVTSGKIVLRRQPFDFNALVRRSLGSFDSRIHEQRLSVKFSEGGGTEPYFIDGDIDRIEQVVANLINNAIKYTPPGGRIDVEVGREGPMALLRVRDTGVGIEQEMLSRIFELFVQAESTVARAQGGMGIGLTLVRSLVDLHGGQVEARSGGRGLGSEFVVRLPLSEFPPASERPHTPEPEPGSARHVLIIEDSADYREMLRHLLEGFGHRVSVASDGPAGVRQASQLHPDAVLVDIGLPGFDGYEVARRIRHELGEQVLLLAVTGYGQPEDRRRAIDAGFNVHLIKPVDIAQIRRLLAEARAASAAP